MSIQSDVSKMLVSRRAASSAISSGGSMRVNRMKSGRAHKISGQEQNRLKHRRSEPETKQHTLIENKAGDATSLDSNKHSEAVKQQNLSEATSAKTNSLPFGYTQMKCLEILKRANRPLYTQEIQLALGSDYPIEKNDDFLAKLIVNPRVQYNSSTRQWLFVSPYQALSGPNAILMYLRAKPLEINKELLDVNENMIDWINKLLLERLCRAVRGTRTSKCRTYSWESGLSCDLYDPMNRCEACQCLQGVFLYSLGPEYSEKVVVDADLKEIWHKILPTTMIDMEAYMDKRNSKDAPNMTMTGKQTRRKSSSSCRLGRINKIANSHIYNDIELSDMFKDD